MTTPGLGAYISGAILFEETLYQSTTDGKKFVDCLRDQNIVPGIKVDKVRSVLSLFSSMLYCVNQVNVVLIDYQIAQVFTFSELCYIFSSLNSLFFNSVPTLAGFGSSTRIKQ